MKYLLIISAFIFSLTISAQAYHTQPLSPDIHTILVYPDDNWKRPPILNIKERSRITISFDRLSEYAFNRLRYRIIHCDAYWNPSIRLIESDYIDGFNDNLIEDFYASRNTTIEYTHFDLQIPNKDVRLKLSGNYTVEIYEDGEPDLVLLTACFSIFDPLVNIAATVSSNTDIDFNKSHQQLSFSILHQNVNIRDPHRDLKVFALQNNRLDTERRNLRPTYISANKLIYEHNKNLIFEAGNEYRRFETSSYKYNGMNVEHIEYNRPTYSMFIVPDKVRAGRGYSYDQDQNGKFIVRSNDADRIDTESDYFNTVFTLLMDEPLPENIYINGEFTYNNFTDKYKMVYNEDVNAYQLSLLLKQGLYNYQYLVKKGNQYTTSAIEGNYYETENGYQVLVYYCPPGQQYDSLIGVQNIQSRAQ